MSSFSMRLNERRKELIKEVKKETKLGEKSKAVTKALEDYLRFKKYLEEKKSKILEVLEG